MKDTSARQEAARKNSRGAHAPSRVAVGASPADPTRKHSRGAHAPSRVAVGASPAEPARKNSWGAHAPSRVASGAPAGRPPHQRLSLCNTASANPRFRAVQTSFLIPPPRIWDAILLLFVFLQSLSALAQDQGFSLRWNPDPKDARKVVVEVKGLPGSTLSRLAAANPSVADWQAILFVGVEQPDLAQSLTAPGMSGNYRVRGKLLQFEPAFLLEPGLKYRATLRTYKLPTKSSLSASLSSGYFVPVVPANPTTVVRQIYPSAEVLPENLLKLYVHFSAPMSRGHIYDHIHLRGPDGKDVELPFLEINEELWDQTMTRLTLFIDPGRIKRGVKPLEEIGPALEQGRQFSLVIARDWQDARGNPLKESYTKTFKVGAPDREAVDPNRWKITPPNAGTTAPLRVEFGESLDHALALRMIQVANPAGTQVEGTSALENFEQRWVFTPRQPWRPGMHRLLAQTIIEDLAGNNIGKPFEVDLFDGVQRRVTNKVTRVEFEIGK